MHPHAQERNNDAVDITATPAVETPVIEPVTIPVEPAATVEPVQPVIEATSQPVVETTEAERAAAERSAKAEAARARAAQLISERKYSEAKKALDEADQMETEPAAWKSAPQRAYTAAYSAIRSKMPKRGDGTAVPEQPAADAAVKEEPVKETAELSPVDSAIKIINLYSKIAAVVGLLPGGLLNFAAILVVQVAMVWRIAKEFGHNESKERVRGSILSLFGSILPTGIGHGAGLAIATIPAVVAGTLVYFLVTPVLAYALTRAVGNVFVMHFESGGTLLTFDPKLFGVHFLNEFKKAGGTLKPEGEATPEPVSAVKTHLQNA